MQVLQTAACKITCSSLNYTSDVTLVSKSTRMSLPLIRKSLFTPKRLHGEYDDNFYVMEHLTVELLMNLEGLRGICSGRFETSE
jgi:hypothetical protein